MKKFNKTLSIALAVGVSLGGVTVAAPAAGAIGGYTSKEMGGYIGDSHKHAQWGYTGGYVTDVKTKDGKVDGFSTQYGTSDHAGAIFHKSTTIASKGFYSDPVPLNSVKVDAYGNNNNPRGFSMSAKKLVYVAAVLGNDIVKNQGLTEKSKEVFSNAGYKGKPTESGYVGFFGENYGISFTHKRADGLTITPGIGDIALQSMYTQADVIAQLSSLMAGNAIYGDSQGYQEVTGKQPMKLDDNGELWIQTPPTMEQFEEVMTTGLHVPYSHSLFAGALTGDSEQLNADTRALVTAFFNIAKALPDDVVSNADIKVRHYVPTESETEAEELNSAWIRPWLIDFNASTIPSVDTLLPDTETAPDPEPETPAIDLHVADVTKDGDGNYKVTRSDGTEWTINLSDLTTRVQALESGKADKTEVDALKKELDALTTKVGTEFTQVKGDITKLKTDITKLTTRVANLEKRVDDVEKSQITKVVGDKGVYKLTRKDGTVVEGVIDTSSIVVSIKDNGDGSVIITRVDGSEDTVTLTHTKVVEDKKKNTVTITTPGGEPVVINTFDTYISDVKKLENGDYEVTRNDGTTWTISTSKLQKQIDDLGSKLDETNKNLAELKETAASKEELAKLQHELDKHTEQLADHEQRLAELEANGATRDDIAALEKDIADNKAAIDGITEQITTIITRVETLEKGVADNTAGIENLKKDFDDVTNQVEKNTGDIANNSNDIADLRDKVVTNTQEIMDLKEKAATKEQLLEVVKQVENHEKRITDLENQGANKDELAKTQAELDELKDKLAELENKAATKADVDKLEREIAEHADKIAVLETETSELKTQLNELTTVVAERFEKVTERISALETRADETDKALEGLGARVTELEVSIQNIKADITKLGDRIDGIEVKIVDLTKRVESLEVSDERHNRIHEAQAKCYSGASVVGIAALLAAPLLMLASGAGNGSQMNTDIQKQLGIFNPEMAKWMAENQSVLQALGAVAGLAATLGLLSYAANQCSDYNRTEEVQKTPIGQLSSKVALRDNKPAEAK